MLASEYGWTKDYILTRVYPIDVVYLGPQIARRQRDSFIDQMSVQVLTDSNVKPEDRAKSFNALIRMRDADPTGTVPDRDFDRAKFEELRKRMGTRKGKAPQRVQ